MGALGRIYPDSDLDLALTIRTFAVADGRIHLWVGGGSSGTPTPPRRSRSHG
jgi:anthranilate/para-aminobenzoate synthase component I